MGIRQVLTPLILVPQGWIYARVAWDYPAMKKSPFSYLIVNEAILALVVGIIWLSTRLCMARRNHLRTPRGHTLTGLLLAGLLLGHVPAGIAGSAESKIEQLRYLPAFLFSEERRDRSWWLNLRYEVACGISAHQLNEYAEMRCRQMCGGDFRYLSYSEDSRDETDPERFCYKIDIVAECIHDEAEPEHQ